MITETEFNTIWQAHFSFIRKIIFAQTYISTDAAEDVAQEVAISIFRHADKIKGSSKFSTWLYRVVVNCCRMNIRFSKSSGNALVTRGHVTSEAWERLQKTLAGDYKDLDAELDNKRRMLVFRKAIREIGRRKSGYVKAFELKALHPKERAGVMRKLGISTPAYKSALMRGSSTLRALLKKWGVDVARSLN